MPFMFARWIPLPGEEDIFRGYEFKAVKAKMSDCLLRRICNARSYVRDVVRAEPDEVDGQQVLVPSLSVSSVVRARGLSKTFCPFLTPEYILGVSGVWVGGGIIFLALVAWVGRLPCYLGPLCPEALCRLHGKILNRIDPYFNLDVKVLEFVPGVEGTRLVLANYLDTCMASAEKELTLADAMDASLKIQASPLFKWAAVERQSKIRAAHELLVAATTSQPLPVGKNDDELHAQIFANVPWFMSVEIDDDDDGSTAIGSAEVPSPKKSRGVEALKQMWRVCKASKTVGLESLKRIATYRHLLSADDARELDGKIQDLFKKATKGRKLVDGQQPEPKRSRKASKAKTQQMLDDVADALLFGDTLA